MLDELLKQIREQGGHLWSLGERPERPNVSERWYAGLHFVRGEKRFCSSGLGATYEIAIRDALANGVRYIPTQREIQALYTKRPATLNLDIKL
jgi:hypothetical protein